MKRILSVVAVLAVMISLAVATASARGPRAKLQLRQTHAGKILVDGSGYTLYAFSQDGPNRDACADIRGCLYAWPAVTTSGRPIAGSGVRASLIGTIPFEGGERQVTYARHPLYTFVSDSGPGDISFLNFLQFGGRWPGLNAAGHLVK